MRIGPEGGSGRRCSPSVLTPEKRSLPAGRRPWKPTAGAWRHLLFFAFSIAVVFAFFAPLRLLFASASRSELNSHTLLVPFASLYLLVSNRKEIFRDDARSFLPGALLIVLGMTLYVVGRGHATALSENDHLSLAVFSAVLIWCGGFLWMFGVEASRRAAFPLLFLGFLVPVPGFFMERIIGLLQYFSAEVSHLLFRLTGVPVYREGFVFHLPGLTVEVARQCGGIRSSIALFITSVLAGHLFLGTGWRKVVLSLAVFPITVFKNGVRIVLLTLLGAYVDGRILASDLHRRGGIPFFFMALVLLGLVLVALRRSERRSSASRSARVGNIEP
jgi:exosortase